MVLVFPYFPCGREVASLKTAPVEYFLPREVHAREGENESRFYCTGKRVVESCGK